MSDICNALLALDHTRSSLSLLFFQDANCMSMCVNKYLSIKPKTSQERRKSEQKLSLDIQKNKCIIFGDQELVDLH